MSSPSRCARWMALALMGSVLGCASAPETPARESPGSATLPAVATTFRFTIGRSADLPFAIEKDLILLPVRVNDSRTMQFLLDTGAGGSILRGVEADKLGLASKGSADVTGGAGSASVRRLAPVELHMPGVDVGHVELAAGLDELLDGLSEHLGRRVDGIFGFNLIAPFVLDVDARHGGVSLHAPSDHLAPPGGDVVPLSFVNNKPAVNLTLVTDRGISVQGVFVVDTGSDGDISVNTPFVRQHQLLGAGQEGVETRNTGVGGDTEAVLIEMPSARIGTTIIDRPMVALSRGDNGNDASAAYDGTIGQHALQRFRVIYDYSNSRMIIVLPREP
jgi:hypothetical protein